MDREISNLKSDISNLKSQISDETDAAQPRRPAFPKSRLIALLIAAVLAWGIFHAVGAYRFNHNPRRAAVVLVCVLGFLGFWALLLWRRAKRINNREDR
jgi:hypothetical protein